MIKDEYLIKLIADYMGISEEEVMKDDFQFTAAFGREIKIELAKVNNIDDLSIFSNEYSITFLLNDNQDLEKLYRTFDGFLKDSKIAYLQLSGTQDNTVDIEEFKIPKSQRDVEVIFEKLNLANLELKNEDERKTTIKVKACRDVNIEKMLAQLGEVDSLEICANNEFDLNCGDIACKVKSLIFEDTDFSVQRVPHFKNVDELRCSSCNGVEEFVSECIARSIKIFSNKSIDLDRINSSAKTLEINNCDFVKVSENFEGPQEVKFNDVALLIDGAGCISVPIVKLTNLKNFDSVLQNGDRFNCDILELGKLSIDDSTKIDSKMLDGKQEVIFNGCDIRNSDCIENIVNTDKISLLNCDVNQGIEDVLVQLKNKGIEISASDMKSNAQEYDARRTNAAITVDNFDAETLEKVLKDNQCIETIIIRNPVSREIREILDTHCKGKFVKSANSNGSVTYEEYEKAEDKLDSIVERIDPTWSELEKAKFLYNELGMIISYDENVLENRHYRDEQEIPYFETANNRARNIYSEVLSGKGVCAGYAEIYTYLCAKAGIDCETYAGNSHGWNFLTVRDQEGTTRSFFVDLTNDATNIKMQMKPRFFGMSKDDLIQRLAVQPKLKISYDKADTLRSDYDNAVTLNLDEIRQVDEKVGFFRHGTEYINGEYVEKLDEINKSVSSNRECAESVMNLLTSDKSFELLKEQEPYNEVESFIGYLNARRSDDEKLDIGVTPCYARFKNITEKQSKSIVWSRDGEEVSYYTYSPKKKNFEKLDKEFIQEVVDRGMLEFYPGGELPGIEEVDKGNGTLDREWAKGAKEAR